MGIGTSGQRAVSIPRGNDAGRLHHQDHAALWRPGPVHHTKQDGEALAWPQFDRPSLGIHGEPALDHVEELVLVIVFVPAIRACEVVDGTW